ncbi:DgyrCDS6933 [Dimorphilus gyrociliatus]|uniref:DgyrCDS6933 n=1 Tax=Dimorphilus gyrociliatus TaxID=2664684 RepID=A0A7I8VR61_9ANNE|nr:DgyrCDS6933 [Dimorphilus gyrociliatus]
MIMAQAYKDLIASVKKILDTFDENSVASETHLEESLASFGPIDETEEIFITNAFSDCVQYSKALKVIVDAFYARDGKIMLNSEKHMYTVFAYLMLLAYKDIGSSWFNKCVLSHHTKKMYTFFQFATDEKHILTWMKDEWNKLYDTSFVQEHFINPLQRHLPELRNLVDSLKDKLDNKNQLKEPKEIPKTNSKPFNLTEVKPRKIPMPQPIPKMPKCKDAPEVIYKQPEEFENLQKISKENRRYAEKRLMDATRSQFSCANTAPSDKTVEKRENILNERNAELKFNMSKAHPLPSVSGRQKPVVRLNAAAILREGERYRKVQEEEWEKLVKLESGYGDSDQFDNWQNRVKEQDELDAKLEAERRRMSGKIAYEEAIIAKKEQIEQKKVEVQQMKKEARKLMHIYMLKKLDMEESQKHKVKNVQDSHQNAQEAKRKVREYKAGIVKQVAEERKELMERALKEAEEEMMKKMELIREIRALEAVPKQREKLVDLTSTPGHGLLTEMSVAELRERLTWLRVEQKEKEEERRDQIFASKQAKDQLLIDTIDTISKHRNELSKAAAMKLEQKKVTRLQTDTDVKSNSKINALQQRLDDLRLQRKETYNHLGHGVAKQLPKKLPSGNKSDTRLAQIEKGKEKKDNRLGPSIHSKSAQRIATAGRQTALAAFS